MQKLLDAMQKCNGFVSSSKLETHLVESADSLPPENLILV